VEIVNEEKQDIEKRIARYLPSVKKPTYQLPFNTKLKWTGFALLMYLALSYVTVYGVEKTSYEYFRFYEIVLGSKFGSVMTLGIGPIVTGGIILQLLVGAKILNWDTTKEEGRRKFQTWSKLLSLVFCFVEAVGLVMANALPVAGDFMIALLVMLQLAAGGVIALLLDELVSKWGFGSGISLFIAAGVSNQILIRVFSPLSVKCVAGDFASCIPSSEFPPSGLIWQFFVNLFVGKTTIALTALLPIIATLGIFLLVVYIQDIGIDIPLSFSALRGFGRSWSLKLLYTSNIPVILAAALIANLQLLARVGLQPVSADMKCGMLACYDKENRIVGGIAYYLTSPSNILEHAVQGTLTASEITRVFTYLVFLCLTTTIFSVFWVSTSGMDAASVAEQLESIGMQIPGYRSDKKSMEAVLNRYIPYLAVLGGLMVGFLAALADFLGVIGSGTGILLTVMILYNYYEQLSAENLEGAHPLVKRFLGE
jgi:preprotein translocase subunit SecY